MSKHARSDLRYAYTLLLVTLGTLGIIFLQAGCAGDTGGGGEEEAAEEIEFDYGKLLIEHNSTDEDTGFQIATDGDAWNDLTIRAPDGTAILSVSTKGAMRDLGLTEMFFETEEPENAEVSIADVLATLPEGTYDFEGTSVDGERIEGEATLTHNIPAGPVITAPNEGEMVDPTLDLTISWNAVTQTIDGDAVTITHYQLIVEGG